MTDQLPTVRTSDTPENDTHVRARFVDATPVTDGGLFVVFADTPDDDGCGGVYGVTFDAVGAQTLRAALGSQTWADRQVEPA